MKWRDLTPRQLREIATDLYDSAHDYKFERDMLIEERGFDVVAATECVARRLQREAARRERKESASDEAKELAKRKRAVLKRTGKPWHPVHNSDPNISFGGFPCADDDR